MEGLPRSQTACAKRGARAGHSTEAIATTISTTAAQSCQCSTSPSHRAPLNTPTTGMNITLRVDATGGKPGGVGKAEDHHGAEPDGSPHGAAGRLPAGRFEQHRQHRDDGGCQHRHPERNRESRHLHAGAPEQLGAQRPAGRRYQCQRHARRAPGQAGELVPEQQYRPSAAALTPSQPCRVSAAENSTAPITAENTGIV